MRTDRVTGLVGLLLSVLIGAVVWGAPPSENDSILPWSLQQEALRWEVMGPGAEVPCEALVFTLDGPAEARVQALIAAGYAVRAVSGSQVSVLAPITLYIDEENGPDALGFVRSTLPYLENWHSVEWQGWTDEQYALYTGTSSEDAKDADASRTWDDAAALYDEGMVAYSDARFWDAIALFQDALTILRSLDEPYAEALALNMLGVCYQDLSDYRNAISYHELSLAIKREIDDWIGIANSLNNLGNCYSALSDYRRAIEHHELALDIRRQLVDPAGVATSLNNLGICYRLLSDYRRAIDYFEESRAIKRGIGDWSGEAYSLNGLGNCYYSLSDFSRAIDCYEQALTIFRQFGQWGGIATSLNNVGDCYASLSDFAQAIDQYEKSLEMCRSIGDRAGVARSLSNIGSCLAYLSAYDQAIDCHMDALAIRYEIEDLAGTAASLNNIANCYARVGESESAVGSYGQALVILEEIGDRSGQAACLNNLGVSYRSLSNYAHAIECHEQALSLSTQVGNREGELNARWGLGRTYVAMEELDAARSHYEEAIRIVESIRGTVEDEELRQSYFGSLRALYEEYLQLLLELGQSEESVFVAERLRARTFLDGLYQLGLAPEQLQLSEAGINRAPDASVPVMDSEALEAAVVEAQGSLLTNEAVLEYMVGEDGIYLWILTNDQTRGPEFIPYAREQLLRDVVALRQAIEPQTRDVEGEPELYFANPTDASEQLYEVLLQPALAQLGETIDTLIFVPSGPLWYVPFAALVMTDQPEIEVESTGYTPMYRPTYLIDRYTLAFLPSLASLPMLMEGDTPSTGSYLALANPILSEVQQTAVGPGYQHEALERACRAFAPYVGGNETDVYVQADAQEAVAIRSATGQRVLMYACHGDFNPSVPLDSRLLLSPSDEEAAESSAPYLLDGDYHASEVLLTDHAGVDLAVLAACETLLPTLREVEGALGLTLGPESDETLSYEQLELIVAGDEVVGLSRAFLSSGAHSVLGTLWQASPTAIERLLIALGAGSQDGLSWAEALRQAQQTLIDHENYDDVWFWASYQLIGRWR